MTRQEIDNLANVVVTKLMPKIEKAIDKRFDQMASTNEELMTQQQLADLLGISLRSLSGKTDIYPSVMIGNRRRFLKSKVLAMLTQQ